MYKLCSWISFNLTVCNWLLTNSRLFSNPMSSLPFRKFLDKYFSMYELWTRLHDLYVEWYQHLYKLHGSKLCKGWIMYCLCWRMRSMSKCIKLYSMWQRLHPASISRSLLQLLKCTSSKLHKVQIPLYVMFRSKRLLSFMSKWIYLDIRKMSKSKCKLPIQVKFGNKSKYLLVQLLCINWRYSK